MCGNCFIFLRIPYVIDLYIEVHVYMILQLVRSLKTNVFLWSSILHIYVIIYIKTFYAVWSLVAPIFHVCVSKQSVAEGT